MHAARLPFSVFAAVAMASVSGQTPYPALTLQDALWTDGTHHYAVTQPIVSPGSELLPLTVSNTADADLQSAQSVRLLPGFHAGQFEGEGRFRAHIDMTLNPIHDIVIVHPDPNTSIANNTVQVPKWERFELGIKLPQSYTTAINNYFSATYPYTNDPYETHTHVPGNANPQTDLNPYADDSLLLVVNLTSPSGIPSMKWAFFMRESRWESDDPLAFLSENTEHPLHPYAIRFRHSFNEIGNWNLNVTIEAPHTTNASGTPLEPFQVSGIQVEVVEPLANAHGPLTVDPDGRRYLKFEDGTPFYAIGTNLCDKIGDNFPWYDTRGAKLKKRNLDDMFTAMSQLSSVGGNFLRTMLVRHNFAPEWVNCGVYDKYQNYSACDLVPVPGTTAPFIQGNSQYDMWAFDQMIEKAHQHNIYMQVCIDPFPTIKAYEAPHWNGHPYYKKYLKPNRNDTPGEVPYDIKELFYTHTNGIKQLDAGAFYFWKRKYKYIISRWGYSNNVAILEFFNEIDQLLTFTEQDLRPENNPDAMCPNNKIIWPYDPLIRATLNSWVTDISTYIRGNTDNSSPTTSPLGEHNKLFTISFAGGHPSDLDYHSVLANEHIDIIDVHRAIGNRWDLHDWIRDMEIYRDNFTSNGLKKPYSRGEFTSYGNYSQVLESGEVYKKDATYKLYDNYDVSFHNELWAGYFSGSFNTGSSWAWDRIFWIPGWLQTSDFEYDALNDDLHRNKNLGFINTLRIKDSNGNPHPLQVKNRTLFQQLGSFAEMANRPLVSALNYHSNSFEPRRSYNEELGIETFYLFNPNSRIAIGWIHNICANWNTATYVMSERSTYVDCHAPNSSAIDIPGFDSGETYYVSYFPTRFNSSEVPDDVVDGIEADVNGIVQLDISSNPFTGSFPINSTDMYRCHLDTLHADYAFIIAPSLVKKFGPPSIDITPPVNKPANFRIGPNPAVGNCTIFLPTSSAYSVRILDMTGRTVQDLRTVDAENVTLSVSHWARGIYSVHVWADEYLGCQLLNLQ